AGDLAQSHDRRLPRRLSPPSTLPFAGGYSARAELPGFFGAAFFGCSSTQRRKPPRKALSLSPRRTLAGSSPSSSALPPPRTTYSGSSAATKVAIVSRTALRHFFVPSRFRPRSPT